MFMLYYHSKNLKKRRITVCGIINEGVISFGVSRCSKKDNFVKSKGRLISQGRAETVPSYSCDYTGRYQFVVLAKQITEFLMAKKDLKIGHTEFVKLEELSKINYSREQQINHELVN